MTWLARVKFNNFKVVGVVLKLGGTNHACAC